MANPCADDQEFNLLHAGVFFASVCAANHHSSDVELWMNKEHASKYEGYWYMETSNQNNKLMISNCPDFVGRAHYKLTC